MDKKLGVLLPSLGTNSVSCFPAPMEKLVATVGGDRTLRVWDTKHRRPHRLSGGKEAIVSMGMVGTCIDISDDASMIAVGHDTGDFTVWDVATFKCLLQNNFRRQGILCIRFSPQGRYLAVGSQEQSIDVYDMQSGFRSGRFPSCCAVATGGDEKKVLHLLPQVATCCTVLHRWRRAAPAASTVSASECGGCSRHAAISCSQAHRTGQLQALDLSL